jgi:hypothetical protein
MEIPRTTKRELRAAKNKLFSKLFDSPTSNAALLHGMLHIKIVGCTKLRNFDRVGNVSSIIVIAVLLYYIDLYLFTDTYICCLHQFVQ